MLSDRLCMTCLLLGAGKEQEALAKQAGFRDAVHYEIAFGLMGVLVLQA